MGEFGQVPMKSVRKANARMSMGEAETVEEEGSVGAEVLLPGGGKFRETPPR